MELDRKGSRIIIDLSKEEDVRGLFAVLSNQHAVPQEILEHGQQIYGWFYTSIQKLMQNYEGEKDIKTMSAESLTFKPFTKPLTRRSKKQ